MHAGLQSGGTAPAVTGRRADAGRPPSRVTPARACAFAVVRRVFEQDAWADRALHAEARRLALDPREHALATQLAYGVVQRRATLDHLIEQLAGRPVDRLQPPVLAALRLGTFQLVFLDRVPAHAAPRCPTARPAKPRCATRTPSGSPGCGSRRSARRRPAR